MLFPFPLAAAGELTSHGTQGSSSCSNRFFPDFPSKEGDVICRVVSASWVGRKMKIRTF